jgi:hypothetical protein
MPQHPAKHVFRMNGFWMMASNGVRYPDEVIRGVKPHSSEPNEENVMTRKLFTLIGLAMTLPGVAQTQNAVTDWNNIAVRTALAGNPVIPPNIPNGMALYLAYVHLAIHDAVNAVQHRYRPYGLPINAANGASAEAAVAAAAYFTLLYEFPAQAATLTATYNGWLAALPDSGKSDGIAAGTSAANVLYAIRWGDGRGANIPYAFPAVPTPGVWMPTPPAFAAPVTPWMGQMVPFTLSSASQFVPGPPPSISSKEWADDYNEVKAVGAANSTIRTPGQTETGLFWTENTAVQYARALRNLAGAYGLDLAETARLFALVWTSSADALIGCWNAKFKYSFWRPVTAIRNGDIDGNPSGIPVGARMFHRCPGRVDAAVFRKGGFHVHCEQHSYQHRARDSQRQ